MSSANEFTSSPVGHGEHHFEAVTHVCPSTAAQAHPLTKSRYPAVVICGLTSFRLRR